jgi:hypothetical protein
MLLLERYLTLFLVLWSMDYSNGQLHLYYSSDGSQKLNYEHDCLDFYASDDISNYNGRLPYRKNHQIIPFCRRDDIDDGLIIPTADIQVSTFQQLDDRNVSSMDLYAWSASIELIEQYQAYRENHIDKNSNASLSRFYNCSLVHRFGHFCQYSFTLSVSQNLRNESSLTKKE